MDYAGVLPASARGTDQGLGGLEAAVNSASQASVEAGDRIKTLQGTQDKLNSQYDSARLQAPTPPEKQNFEPFKAPGQENPLNAFGSLAMVFATLASLKTRNPLTTSLKAATAAITAVKQQNTEAYQSAYEQWKTNTDFAYKQANYEMELYNAASQKHQNNLNALASEYRNIAAGIQDAPMQATLASGRVDLANKLLEARGKTLNEWPQAQANIEKLNAETYPMLVAQDQMKKWVAANPGATPEQVMQAKNEFFPTMATAAENRNQASLSPDAIETIAERYLAGDISGVTGLGYGAAGSANRAAVAERVSQMATEKGMNGADIAAGIAEYRGVGAGETALGRRTAQVSMAVNEAKQLAPLAVDASRMVPRSQFPTLNSLILAADKGTGGENVVRLGIAVNSLINVYARAISPTGAPTVSDKDHARDLLSAAWSSGQLETGVDQLMKEMNAAQQAPGNVRQEFRSAVSKGSPITGGAPHKDPLGLR